MKGKVKDYDKLMIIAQTYFYLRGSFTTNELYNFIVNHGFKFHSGPSRQGIGINISKSKRFKKIEGSPARYEVI